MYQSYYKNDVIFVISIFVLKCFIYLFILFYIYLYRYFLIYIYQSIILNMLLSLSVKKKSPRKLFHFLYSIRIPSAQHFIFPSPFRYYRARHRDSYSILHVAVLWPASNTCCLRHENMIQPSSLLAISFFTMYN